MKQERRPHGIREQSSIFLFALLTADWTLGSCLLWNAACRKREWRRACTLRSYQPAPSHWSISKVHTIRTNETALVCPKYEWKESCCVFSMENIFGVMHVCINHSFSDPLDCIIILYYCYYDYYDVLCTVLFLFIVSSASVQLRLLWKTFLIKKLSWDEQMYIYVVKSWIAAGTLYSFVYFIFCRFFINPNNKVHPLKTKDHSLRLANHHSTEHPLWQLEWRRSKWNVLTEIPIIQPRANYSN